MFPASATRRGAGGEREREREAERGRGRQIAEVVLQAAAGARCSGITDRCATAWAAAHPRPERASSTGTTRRRRLTAGTMVEGLRLADNLHPLARGEVGKSRRRRGGVRQRRRRLDPEALRARSVGDRAGARRRPGSKRREPRSGDRTAPWSGLIRPRGWWGTKAAPPAPVAPETRSASRRAAPASAGARRGGAPGRDRYRGPRRAAGPPARPRLAGGVRASRPAARRARGSCLARPDRDERERNLDEQPDEEHRNELDRRRGAREGAVGGELDERVGERSPSTGTSAEEPERSARDRRPALPEGDAGRDRRRQGQAERERRREVAA